MALELGYETTTVQQISDAAEVSQSTKLMADQDLDRAIALRILEVGFDGLEQGFRP